MTTEIQANWQEQQIKINGLGWESVSAKVLTGAGLAVFPHENMWAISHLETTYSIGYFPDIDEPAELAAFSTEENAKLFAIRLSQLADCTLPDKAAVLEDFEGKSPGKSFDEELRRLYLECRDSVDSNA